MRVGGRVPGPSRGTKGSVPGRGIWSRTVQRSEGTPEAEEKGVQKYKEEETGSGESGETRCL